MFLETPEMYVACLVPEIFKVPDHAQACQALFLILSPRETRMQTAML